MIKVVVPFSGGKDSYSCLKLAVQEYGADAVLGLFCDTGFEHPLTYAYIETVQRNLNVRIVTISAGTVEQKILRFQRFPSALSRFCTSDLKIAPSIIFYRDLMEEQGGYEVWLGMRSGESSARKKRYENFISDDVYFPHDVLGKFPKYLAAGGVRFRLPILDWSTEDVFSFIKGEKNPLYGFGFDRVGCFPCLASSPQKQQNAFNFDAFGYQQKQKVIWLESQIGKKHQPAQTEQLCMFCQV